jgi:hypothetical protein
MWPKFTLTASCRRSPQASRTAKSARSRFAFQCLSVRRIPGPLRLLRSQPVAESDPDLLDSLDASYASSQVWAQQTTVGRFVSEAAHRAEAKVDGAGSQTPRFQVYAIPENNGLAEREPRLRAVPFNEFFDRVSVASLSVDRTEAVQNRRFRLVQVRQAQDCFGNAPFPLSRVLLGRRRGPPRPQLDDGRGSGTTGASLGSDSDRLRTDT